MASRMERYQNDIDNSSRTSRTEKHKNLYQDFYTKAVFKEIELGKEDEIENRAIDLNQMRLEKTSREKYHKIKEIEDYIDPDKRKKVDDLSLLFQKEKEEQKVYDINSVLESAKKNRQEEDELEQRRKLKNTDYNILASIKPEQISKIGEDKNLNREEQLQELIDMITSGEEKETNEKKEEDLLSELMPSSDAETIISEQLSKEILEKEKDFAPAPVKEEKQTMDASFYTRSMDLSDQDFDADPTDEEFIDKESPLLTFFKIFLMVLMVVGIIVLVFYFMTRI